MTADNPFNVTFWGVRGSIPCPGPDTFRYGGNTSCLEVRCGDCSGGTCSGAADVRVTVDPDLVPPDLASTLRAVRRDVEVLLSWATVPEARTYFYRAVGARCSGREGP